MAWIGKCLWKSPSHKPHNFSLKNADNLTLSVSYRSINYFHDDRAGGFPCCLHLMNSRKGSSLNSCGPIISVLAALTALLCVTSVLLCFRELCAGNISVLVNIYHSIEWRENQELWNLLFLVCWCMDNTVRHFHCSLGKNHRCDPTDTYLEQRLHCPFTWGAAERNRIFLPLWYTAADPVKSQLLQVVPLQSGNASFLQSFTALNSLNNPLNYCSSCIRVAVLPQTLSPSSFVPYLPHRP